ncbi:lanC 3 isoform X3 isoform A [Micractinium conductrix]|uniref:LanC 3 isoform X3 isoform A n=1 Tax=Micractinium conductrix TaxID=554055 RepID=A0A2P6V1U8_9CHLO|nr:lanC 3 isoform X3 isoform A [Micractinium conductrix]|eukprot:PSC68070.1 lanC 3 isoform X3 isoform A [Micractinium conductrix]
MQAPLSHRLAEAIARIDGLISALQAGELFSASPAAPAQPAPLPPAPPASSPTPAASKPKPSPAPAAEAPAAAAGKKAKAPKAPKPAAAPAAEEEPFAKAHLVVGRVASVGDHPSGSEKLWLCKVDVGGGQERQVVAGLRQHVGREELTGRLLVLVLNLKPAKLVGELSEAMILAADHTPEGGEALVRVLSVPEGCSPGDAVYLEGSQPGADAGFPKECKSKVWKEVVAGLAVAGGRPTYKGTPLCCARPFTFPQAALIRSGDKSSEWHEWWPAGLKSPTVYYLLRTKQLRYLQQHPTSAAKQQWRHPADCCYGASGVLRRRRHQPLAIHVPAAMTGIDEDDAAAGIEYLGTQLLPLRRPTLLRVTPLPPPQQHLATQPPRLRLAQRTGPPPVATAPMPMRYFRNRLPDHVSGTLVAVDAPHTLQSFSVVLQRVLGASASKPSVYTGAAGVAYALWHAARHAPALAPATSEEYLLGGAQRYAAAALAAVAGQPPERYGWALLAGQAGVYCTGALVYDAAVALAAREGRSADAAAAAAERQHCVQAYAALQPLACSNACQEDEVLYGRAGYLLGCLLLNKRLQPEGGAVPQERVAAVVRAIVESGRQLAGPVRDRGAFPTPLFYLWPPGPDADPYLGAAHGLMGILFALLHAPEALAALPGAQADVEGALRYVLGLECDAEGKPGPGGHYPTQMGPWRDRQPLVQWCHGATGAVYLFCKAHEAVGGGSGRAYLAAAERAGEAVWEHGLLKKGPGACHGVSGSALALLRLYRATGSDRWLHRALQFAAFTDSPEFRSKARTPDRPQSLYEGEAARLCLLADLLGAPRSAAFPLFEVDL